MPSPEEAFWLESTLRCGLVQIPASQVLKWGGKPQARRSTWQVMRIYDTTQCHVDLRYNSLLQVSLHVLRKKKPYYSSTGDYHNLALGYDLLPAIAFKASSAVTLCGTKSERKNNAGIGVGGVLFQRFKWKKKDEHLPERNLKPFWLHTVVAGNWEQSVRNTNKRELIDKNKKVLLLKPHKNVRLSWWFWDECQKKSTDRTRTNDAKFNRVHLKISI